MTLSNPSLDEMRALALRVARRRDQIIAIREALCQRPLDPRTVEAQAKALVSAADHVHKLITEALDKSQAPKP